MRGDIIGNTPSNEKRHHPLNRSDVICEASFHRWRHTERLLHASEVVCMNKSATVAAWFSRHCPWALDRGKWWAHLVGALRVHPHERWADHPPQKDRGTSRHSGI